MSEANQECTIRALPAFDEPGEAVVMTFPEHAWTERGACARCGRSQPKNSIDANQPKP